MKEKDVPLHVGEMISDEDGVRAAESEGELLNFMLGSRE